MAEYGIDQSIRSVVRRRLVRNSVPLMVVAISVGLAVAYVNAGTTAGMVFVIPLALIAASIGLFKGYRMQMKQFASFRLTVLADRITREMSGVPPLTIRREELRAIQLHSSGEITLKTDQPASSIRIPSHVGEREHLLRELNQWRIAEPAPSVASPLPALAAGIGAIGAFAVVMLSHNRIVIIAVGSALFIALLTCFVLIWRNKQVHVRIRRLAFAVLLPAAAVLAHVIAAIRAV